MWEERAVRARREIAALGATGLGLGALHAAAIDVVEAVVPSDLTCWATLDPESLVISTMVSGRTHIPATYEPLLAEAEYTPTEPNAFADLARQQVTWRRLSDLDDHARRTSRRLNTVWRPLGLDRELRVLFRSDQVSWGGAGLVRAGQDFTDREIEFMTAVAPAIAGITRRAVCREVLREPDGDPSAVVVVGRHGRATARTAAADRWREHMDEIAPGRFQLMMTVMAAGARTSTSGMFRARLRDSRGRWSVLRASPLIGSTDDQVAVEIEPASGDALIALLFLAYGLTAREQDICRQVIAGRSTAATGERLFISTNTVQDHLKSIFAKVGVRSRGELVARLRPGAPLA